MCLRRRYRRKEGEDEGADKLKKTGSVAEKVMGAALSATQAAQLAALEEEVVRNVEEAVKLKVEEAMASEEVQRKIQVCKKECVRESGVSLWCLSEWCRSESVVPVLRCG
jgi:hypothetical protein